MRRSFRNPTSMLARLAQRRAFSSPINVENNLKIQNVWNTVAPDYRATEIATMQALTTAAYMVGAHKANRILEVGCGTGSHSLALSSVFLKPESGVLVSCDYAPAMIEQMKEALEDSEFKHVPGNKFYVDAETDYATLSEDGLTLEQECPIEEIVASQGLFRKFILGCRANNELLPFPSEWFEAYIANMSLFYVDNPVNQIEEAYRVVAPGGAACFTVWGQKHNCELFKVTEDAAMAEMTEEQIKTMMEAPSPFRLFADEGEWVKEQLHKAGFTRLKVWEQPANFMFKDGPEFMSALGTYRLDALCTKFGLSGEARERAFEKSMVLFEERFGPSQAEMKSHSAGIFVAFKD